jgi:hypothetical protein
MRAITALVLAAVVGLVGCSMAASPVPPVSGQATSTVGPTASSTVGPPATSARSAPVPSAGPAATSAPSTQAPTPAATLTLTRTLDPGKVDSPTADELISGVRPDLRSSCVILQMALPKRATAGVACRPKSGLANRAAFYSFATQQHLVETYPTLWTWSG